MLREVRREQGLSQARLAARAGTTQSAISRIESGSSSPSVATLQALLALMGRRLVLSGATIEDGVDRVTLRANLGLAPAERVRRGLAFSDFVRRNRGAVGR